MKTVSQIIFSASNALNKWLKLDLPRLPSPDGKRIGTQSLITDAKAISWQCHVVSNTYNGHFYTVIAVEAYSRFTLLLPFDFAPTQNELQERICQQWTHSLVSLMVQHGELPRELAPLAFSHIIDQMDNVAWWRNTDLSVNGHVGDAGQWVTQTIADRNIDALSDDDALDLAYYINSFHKRAKDDNGKKRQFYPVPNFVEDGLSRFMSGWLDSGDIPDPYQMVNSKSAVKNNVVSMADYRAGKVK